MRARLAIAEETTFRSTSRLAARTLNRTKLLRLHDAPSPSASLPRGFYGNTQDALTSQSGCFLSGLTDRRPVRNIEPRIVSGRLRLHSDRLAQGGVGDSGGDDRGD